MQSPPNSNTSFLLKVENMNDSMDAVLGIISAVDTLLLLCHIFIFPTMPWVMQAAGRQVLFIILGSSLFIIWDHCWKTGTSYHFGIMMHLFLEKYPQNNQIK